MLLENNNFEFGELLLDTREKVLLRGGKPLPITPKAFELLLVLVENHGHLVEKDELMKLVWADSFVEEGNLTFTIGLLRKLLEDDTKMPHFIQTVPRRGYRFIAPVTTREYGAKIKPFVDGGVGNSNGFGFDVNDGVKTANDSANLRTSEFAPKKNRTAANFLSPKTKAALGLIIAVLLIGASALGYWINLATNGAVGDKKSIAILPLKPVNIANRDDIYEIGIAESLIRKLGSMKGFVARPLSAIRRYTDIDQDSLAAGSEQRADYVLASTYQLANGKIRVSSQLINIANGQTEETYISEKDLTNLFAMQDSIADDIGNMLSARFAATAGSQAAKRGTTNEAAYRLYLQAMYLYDRRTPADAQKAVGLLEQAIQLDPEFARAWAGKAHVHRSLGNFGRDTHEEYRKSIEAINIALALDENLADAHSALCENKFFYERDLAGAEIECKRAIELEPNSSLSHQIYSRNLMVIGHFDESIAEIKTAIDLEPTSLFSQRNFGISFYYARRYTEAIAQFKRVTEMDPNFEATYPWLINALKLQGNDAEAFDWFMKWQAVQKTDHETIQIFKTAYQKSGWPGIESERITRFDESRIRTYFMEACMAALAGNNDKALEYLENSSQRREWGMAYIRFEPTLDVLRGDPRFDEIVSRVDAK
ncbi:MAG: winged helix-turn-helix domain-containing protein [Pyrinomonadaceae bacterium]